MWVQKWCPIIKNPRTRRDPSRCKLYHTTLLGLGMLQKQITCAPRLWDLKNSRRILIPAVHSVHKGGQHTGHIKGLQSISCAVLCHAVCRDSRGVALHTDMDLVTLLGAVPPLLEACVAVEMFPMHSLRQISKDASRIAPLALKSYHLRLFGSSWRH